LVFFVTLSCRALHALETGTVASKRAATEMGRAYTRSILAFADRTVVGRMASRASLTIDPTQTVLMAEFVHCARKIADAKAAAKGR
jgi:microcompartment protein CcmL/EutN